MTAIFQRHHRIVRETAWVFAGQGAAALATLVGLRVITELVPPVVYGTVALALGVVALAQGLAVGPLMQAVLRYYPDLAARGRVGELRSVTFRALRRLLAISSLALLLFAIGWAVAEPSYAVLAALTVALFAVEVARSVEVTFLNAARRQRAMALLVAADAWLRPLAAVAVVWAWGPHGAAVMAGYLIGAALVLAAYRVTARVQPLPTPGAASADTHGLAARLQAYAWPLTALPLIGWVSGQADRYLIGALAGVSAAGIYAALYGLASKSFLMLSASVELALRQPFYARVADDDQRGARVAFGVWLGGVLAAAFALWGLFALFHAEIAAVLLAAEYRAHAALMAWIAAGYVLLAAAQVFERVCYAYHDTRGVLLVQAAGAALSVAIAAPLVWRHGIEGAAWAVPAYFGAQLLLTMARAHHAWRQARPLDSAAQPVARAGSAPP